MDSAGKGAKSQKPAHVPPLQARVVAANRTVRTTSDDDPGARGHGQVGAKQNERGKNNEGSGHGMANVAAGNKASRTRPLQANTAGGQSDRHRP